jgi:hypothetical protein
VWRNVRQLACELVIVQHDTEYSHVWLLSIKEHNATNQQESPIEGIDDHL